MLLKKYYIQARKTDYYLWAPNYEAAVAQAIEDFKALLDVDDTGETKHEYED